MIIAFDMNQNSPSYNCLGKLHSYPWSVVVLYVLCYAVAMIELTMIWNIAYGHHTYCLTIILKCNLT